jgi:serine/threonine protein kinase
MAESKKIAGRYQILDEVGQGSESIVYRAKDELLGRIVAIKTFRSWERYPNPMTLMNEARVMARVQHPNIMPIHDFIRENDSIYLIMPLISRNAVNWFSDSKEKSLNDLFRFLDRIADALDFLHSHQIIYRNLKPGSILVSEDSQPYLIGFTISEIRDPDKKKIETSLNKMLTGVFGYMAPEILEGDESTNASDIFSFGIIMYELITAQNPYKARWSTTSIDHLMDEEFPSIQEQRPEL